MSPVLIPAAGVVLWLVHVAQVVRGSGLAWARWACLAGLPVASIASYLCWTFAVPVATPATKEFSRADSVLLGNAFLGIAAWFVFLALEPILLLVGRQVAGRRRSSATR